MKISREFQIAVKLADRPAYVIAQEAAVDPHWLSKLLHRAVSISEDDPRILRIAKVLNLSKEKLFEVKS